MVLGLETAKAVIGVLSVIGATVSGVAALLVEYKDMDGKITKWGRYAVIGLLLSFAIGTVNVILDHVQKTRETQEAAARALDASEKTLRIVTDINRSLNP